MDRNPRAVLLTGDQLRHRFAARRLADHLDLVGVVSEGKAALPLADPGLAQQDREVFQRHFRERDDVERRFLGGADAFPDTHCHEVQHGRINDATIFEWVMAREPEVVVLYGSSIVKEPLSEAYGDRMINLHLGLSPYYRGSGTNFWPLVNREPECVGATIHLAVREVDAGAILVQVRPEPDVDDRAHELGTKALIAGLDAIPPAAAAYLDGAILPRVQDLSKGRVYRRRDVTAEATRQMWSHFDSGMMEEYVEERDARQARFPIIELP
jgi:folate-dependent phosphoribosylglycinamide formyltransferase PurN